MRLKRLELTGFKSFAKKTIFLFESPVTAIVGPNGSGKSNCAEAFRWVLGERSMKSLRSGRGEDLIFNGGGNASKMNRASVTLVFENQDRVFNVDFDEVAIGREVYRDGTNVYLINGSPVRFRDIVELLTTVALGSSDHYIVNQGDADRILSANVSERRTMIEDALGLRLYQWKIEESEKKLEKTEENLEQVGSLRRELVPHLRFLKKQMEKIEQADKLRQELKQAYFEYFNREENYLAREAAEIKKAREAPAVELHEVEKQLQAISGQTADHQNEAETAALNRLAIEERELASRRNELDRQLGRLEGRLEIKEAELKTAISAEVRDFSYAEVAAFGERLAGELDQAERLFDLNSVKGLLARVKDLLQEFLRHGHAVGGEDQEIKREIGSIQQELTKLEAELSRVAERSKNLQADREKLNQKMTAAALALREAERATYERRARRTELLAALEVLRLREDNLKIAEENFKRELTEAKVLVDQEVERYHRQTTILVAEESRQPQEERLRKIERLKIKLEDLGLESTDTVKEYQEATDRDAFLAKEVADLEASGESLRQIIKDLQIKIDFEFKAGIAEINRHFQDFFVLMFGGGTASLSLAPVRRSSPAEADEALADFGLAAPLTEAKEEKEGIEIKVNLPRKKIHGLEMLSGGERALTSIALLFAMSQVNPPPFLILDETDAALDEANSRKYGEMVSNLAKHSQLLLITHNRETMSRAGVIYGITMGGDGVSKQLSIKFDEAANYAK